MKNAKLYHERLMNFNYIKIYHNPISFCILATLFKVKMVSREEINSLLKVQRDAYNDLINHMTTNFNTQISTIRTELETTKSELGRTKEELHLKQVHIDQLSKRIEDFESAVEAYKFDPVPVFERLDSLEDHSRRNNLRIDGVPEITKENWENTAFEVRKISKQVGFESEVKLDRAHRIGNFRVGDRPRTIVVRFHNFSDRNFFLRNSHKLKGTKIFVNEDLSQTSLNKRKDQLHLLQKARSEGKTAYFSHTKLIIKEKSNLNILRDSSSQETTSFASRLSQPTAETTTGTLSVKSKHANTLVRTQNTAVENSQGNRRTTRNKV